MIRNAQVIFCDNEHGSGDVCFPDLTHFGPYELQQTLIEAGGVRHLRQQAKAAGWGRVNGGDYCPGCMETMEDAQ